MPAILILLLVNNVRWNAQQQQAQTSGIGYLVGLIALWAVLLLVIPCLLIRSRFKKEISFHEDTTFTISEDRIDIESATASSRLDWSRIARAVETRKYFYLFESKKPTYIIPKRSLSVGTEIPDLRQILRHSVNGNVQLLP